MVWFGMPSAARQRFAALAVGIAACLGLMTAPHSPAHANIFEGIDTSADGTSARRPPTFVVVPLLRLAVRRSIGGFDVEAFSRPALGMAITPFRSDVSQFSGGLAISRDLGWASAGVAVEVIAGYDTVSFGRFSSGAYEFTGQLSRTIAFEGTPWSISPRVAINHRATSDPAKVRTKIEFALPIYYQLTPALDAVFIPKIDARRYAHFADRTDTVANVAIGLRYRLSDFVQISGFFAYENRWSGVPDVRYSRWLLVPQLSLRASF